MGRCWRTGEATVGTRAGIFCAGTVRRVGAHRQWDCDGLEHVRGLLWQWDPAQGDIHPDLKARGGDSVGASREDGGRPPHVSLETEGRGFLVLGSHGRLSRMPGDHRRNDSQGHSEACRFAWRALWTRRTMDANDVKSRISKRMRHWPENCRRRTRD